MAQDEKITLEKVAELSIYEWNDRAAVATALLKNGYTIGPGKRKKTPTGKQMDYFLKIYRDTAPDTDPGAAE